jgi:hypothetical protein
VIHKDAGHCCGTQARKAADPASRWHDETYKRAQGNPSARESAEPLSRIPDDPASRAQAQSAAGRAAADCAF